MKDFAIKCMIIASSVGSQAYAMYAVPQGTVSCSRLAYNRVTSYFEHGYSRLSDIVRLCFSQSKNFVTFLTQDVRTVWNEYNREFQQRGRFSSNKRMKKKLRQMASVVCKRKRKAMPTIAEENEEDITETCGLMNKLF